MMNINEIDIPKKITREWLDFLMIGARDRIEALDAFADTWERDRAERAKNTIRIPDEKDWSVGTRNIFIIESDLSEMEWYEKGSGLLVSIIPRSSKSPETIRAELIAKINGASDDELADLAEKIKAE